jgi:hypothetical protein
LIISIELPPLTTFSVSIQVHQCISVSIYVCTNSPKRWSVIVHSICALYCTLKLRIILYSQIGRACCAHFCVNLPCFQFEKRFLAVEDFPPDPERGEALCVWRLIWRIQRDPWCGHLLNYPLRLLVAPPAGFSVPPAVVHYEVDMSEIETSSCSVEEDCGCDLSTQNPEERTCSTVKSCSFCSACHHADWLCAGKPWCRWLPCEMQGRLYTNALLVQLPLPGPFLPWLTNLSVLWMSVNACYCQYTSQV